MPLKSEFWVIPNQRPHEWYHRELAEDNRSTTCWKPSGNREHFKGDYWATGYPKAKATYWFKDGKVS